MSKNNVVRGKLPYKDDEGKKKDKKKLKKEAFEKEKKKIKKQSLCNHLDCDKNKTHFKPTTLGEGDDAIRCLKCKICGGLLINDPVLMSKKSVKMSERIMYTVYARFRNAYNPTGELERQIISAIAMNKKVVRAIDRLQSESVVSSKKRKNKDGGNKKKNKNKVKNFRQQY